MYCRSSGPTASIRYRPCPIRGKLRSRACLRWKRSRTTTAAAVDAAAAARRRTVRLMPSVFPRGCGTKPTRHGRHLPPVSCFGRVDVVAVAPDGVILATDDEQIAILVAVAEIAGVQPAVAECPGGGFRIVVVALHHGVAAEDDLSQMLRSRRWLVTVLADHPHLHSPNRFADRSHLAMFGIDVDCAEGGCLRQSVSLQDDKGGELMLECANYLARNRRTTADTEPQRGQVAASGIDLQ